MDNFNAIAGDDACEQISAFDYQSLDLKTRAVIELRTNEIKERIRRTTQDIIEIGDKLIEVKDALSHGQFGLWLKSEFDWDERTAQRFMSVAAMMKSDTVSDLGWKDLSKINIAPDALYVLAAKSTPQEIRREVLERAYRGESFTQATVKKLVAERKAKRSSKKSQASTTAHLLDNKKQVNSSMPTLLPDKILSTDIASPTAEQNFVLGEWVEVRTCNGNKTWDGLIGPVTRVEQHEITVQLDEGKWKHLRFYRDELVKVPAKSFYKSDNLVLIDCPASAEIEYRQWNGCWGLVKSVGQLGSVEVVVAGETMRFKPSDLDILDNPSPLFVSVAEQVVRLLKRDDLDEFERQLLTLYLRRQVFSQRQLDLLASLVEHYENSGNIRF